ncbi:MAG: nuclear transport factor 2 family protein [Myxococcales bacterium]
MTDYPNVANAVARFFAAIDARDWAGAEQLMARPFHLDYSSFGGGPPAELPPSAILDGWKKLLPGFDHTHHQLGNLDVEAGRESAVVRCYGTATHVLGLRVWTVVGTYRVTLRREERSWVLTGLQFNFKYQAGDLTLAAEAQGRAATR